MNFPIDRYRRALRITDTQQDTAITETAERVEAAILNYLEFPSFAEFFYEWGEEATTTAPLEAACVGAVVETFDDPAAPIITEPVRSVLRPFRPTKVG